MSTRTWPGRSRRQQWGDWVLHAPQTLRALVRADEIWLTVLAAVVGIGAGIIVVTMNGTIQLLHETLFQIPSGGRLSSASEIALPRLLLVPSLGGLLLGLFGLALARWRPHRAIDPIEANALYGGRMSVIDSIIVCAQTLLSCGVGASVGLEAGYTQMGSAIASWLGRSFRLRRTDLRLMVGCGAAGAIGAAFNAPLAGAFYGIELVIGTYTIGNLAPVVVASLSAVFVERGLHGGIDGFSLLLPDSFPVVQFVPILALGIICALVAIAVMRGVTVAEGWFRRSPLPVWSRPMVGGLIVGLCGMVTPMVLSSGHGALRDGLGMDYPLLLILTGLVLKSIASAVSIGSGFRGGLFFASLFLGSLVGKVFAGVLALLAVGPVLPPVVYGLIGMSAMAVAVIGGPLTMCFLALESTQSFPLTVAVLAAVIVSSLTARRTFGYSFATWRFHLRGEAIRSAVDIGWVNSLSVGRMMRRDQRTIPTTTTLDTFRRDFPLGSTHRVIVVDESGRYAGIVQTSEAFSPDITAERVGELLHVPDTVLTPAMTVKTAIALFEESESDALAVVDNSDHRHVIGLLTEQHALRRYTEELDRRRRELSGE
ncbi:chloride channel protein [Acidisoma silvae]|uniref:Chloride channel protein n=1 Tax=Acidisoma silvae TaxID=2802396 RepID=A0A963YN64_9PROT|nr:chloride channel protein [Acidisoma silvae]MCB8873958.1 chloride channel protein [Acidisoma silvae]